MDRRPEPDTSVTTLTPETVRGVGYTLSWVGAQRQILAGDLTPRVDLRALATRPHVNAVGPLAGLRGEVTVIDGVPLISRVSNVSVRVEQSFEHRACFLVQAEVPRWTWTTESGHLPEWAALGPFLRRVVSVAGIDPDRPFPFRVVGRAESGTIHVLDKRDDRRHSPELHEEAKVQFALHDEDIEMIGFHSENHRGIFVPRESPIHAHLAARGRTIAGHVDALQLGEGWRIAVPSAAPEENET
jgi:hypothetical protein